MANRKQKDVCVMCAEAGKLAIDENVLRDGLRGKEALRASPGRCCCKEDYKKHIKELTGVRGGACV